MNKKVSVIVPVYNSEKYLSRSLNSIINQSYKNLEIIVIDDSSTDNSKNMIKKYASKDNRIRPFYSEVNCGVSKARNNGLSTFTGDYVFFIDADDYIEKDCIKTMVDASKKYNSDFVDCFELVIYNKNGKTYKFTEKKLPKNDLVLGNIYDNIEVLTKSTYIKGKLIKKELLEDIKFDESLKRYEDLVFEHELKIKIKNMVLLNRPLYHYYQVSDSLINTLGEKHYSYLDASKKVLKTYEKSSKNIKDEIESLLFSNAFFTGISKIVKNDESLDYNVDLLYKYLEESSKIFKNYKENKKINFLLKSTFTKLLGNKKKIRKIVKKTKKIDFINIYFRYLSIVNKY